MADPALARRFQSVMVEEPTVSSDIKGEFLMSSLYIVRALGPRHYLYSGMVYMLSSLRKSIYATIFTLSF